MCKVSRKRPDSVQIYSSMSSNIDSEKPTSGLSLRKLARPNKRTPSSSTRTTTVITQCDKKEKKKNNNIFFSVFLLNGNYDMYKVTLLGARLLVIIVGLFFVILDVITFKLSTSNGRFISFLDSFENCFAFRVQQPFQPIDDSRQPLSPRRSSYSYHIGETCLFCFPS